MSSRAIAKQKERGNFQQIVEMAIARLRDQDRLDGASNYVIWKKRMSSLLDEFGLKAYIDNALAVPQDAYQQKEYKKEIARAKRLILDGV